MAVRDTLNKLENLVASASHLPLTGKALIDEDELVHLIDELRNGLPEELDHAVNVINERDEILKEANTQADGIIKKAKLQAEQLVNENDVVIKARETSRMVIAQAQQQSQEILDTTNKQARQLQSDAENYANQVFDQLIAYVVNTTQGVQATVEGLRQAQQILQHSKMQMNQQSNQYAYNQMQQQQQNISYAQQSQNFQPEQ